MGIFLATKFLSFFYARAVNSDSIAAIGGIKDV